MSTAALAVANGIGIAPSASGGSPAQGVHPPPPVFICVALLEEQQQQQQQLNCGGGGGSPASGNSRTAMAVHQQQQRHNSPPSMSISSCASSSSQDSAICGSSSTACSPLPPPDPGALQPQSPAPTTLLLFSAGLPSPLVQLTWLAVDPAAEGQQQMPGQLPIGGHVTLEPGNALDQLNKIASDAEEMHKGRRLLLVCSRETIRQSLYPLCAQSLMAKMAAQGEDQLFTAKLPLASLFHSFVPFVNPSGTKNAAEQQMMASTGNGTGDEEAEAEKEQTIGSQCPEAEAEDGMGPERRILEQRVRLMAQSVLSSSAAGGGGGDSAKTAAESRLEHVQQGYCAALCTPLFIDSRTVVRARGLPWQVSDLDVALFFAGLDISPGGIALCLGPEGRRNGECLVRLERAEHREWALQRHRRHLHQRYIEVYRAAADDFVRHAIGKDPVAIEFAQRADQGRAMIVRMRGLPFTATEQQIRDFFASDGQPGGLLDQGVLFVLRADGRPSGDAFVLFTDEQSGRRALAKHKQRMGSRYIELFRTTQAEVQQLFNARHAVAQQLIQHQQQAAGGGQNRTIQQQQVVPVLAALANRVPAADSGPGHHHPHHQPKQRDCLRLRGLPYEAQVQQVVEFLGPHARRVLFQGVHMIYNAAGHPSGETFIQMESEQAASQAAQDCHNKYMELGKKRRYIEVFQCCAEDMSLLLNILPSAQQAPAAAPPGPPPPLIPLPFSPVASTGGAAAMATPSPLLAFTAAGPFLHPHAFGPVTQQTIAAAAEMGTPMVTASGLLLPPNAHFATQLAQLYSPDSLQISHSQAAAEFWLRNSLIAASGVGGALRSVAGFLPPSPLMPLHHINGGSVGPMFCGAMGGPLQPCQQEMAAAVVKMN